MRDLRRKVRCPHSDAISLSGWSRGPELSRLFEAPCHSDWSHKHKRPRCNCYNRSVFLVTMVAASVRQPALKTLPFNRLVFAEHVALWETGEYFETFKVVACMMALVPFQFQIHLWNWEIARRFGTACCRDGSGKGLLRTENAGNFFQIPKKIWNFSSVKTTPKAIFYGKWKSKSSLYDIMYRPVLKSVEKEAKYL